VAINLPPVPDSIRVSNFELYRFLIELRRAFDSATGSLASDALDLTGVSLSDLGSHKHSDLSDIRGAAAGAGVVRDGHVSDADVAAFLAPPTGVTNAQLADMPAATIKAKQAGAPGAPQDLTLAQVLDSFTTTPFAVLYRAPGGWTFVPPPTTNGQRLTYDSAAGGSLKWA
jgi:hypothetical protein